MRYILEDDFHAQWLRKFDTEEAAIAELRRLEKLAPAELAKEIGQVPCADRCGHRELVVIEETGKEVARARPSG
jgi:hypothetical protein